MIETERLSIRPWRNEDVAPFYRLGQDEAMMRTLGPLLTLDDARATMIRQQACQARRGYSFWVIERRHDGAMIGLCGIQPGPAGTPIADRSEIGWRLARDCWGQGYAREAAAACIAWWWRHGDGSSLFAITTPDNARSRGLMERLGMSRMSESDFDHPALAEGDPLRGHLTYRIDRPDGG